MEKPIVISSNREPSKISDVRLNEKTASFWKGNVRELINVLEYAFVLCMKGEITENHLPAHFSNGSHGPQPLSQETLLRSRNTPTKEKILKALESASGNRTQAAKLLGVSRVTLWKYMKSNR